MLHGRGLVVAFAVLLGLTLVGEPAPTALGLVEGLLAAGVAALALAGVARARLVRAGRIGAAHASILVVVGGWCLSQLGALALGVVQGAAPAAAVRAAAPYLVFLPLAVAGPWLAEGTQRATVRALVAGGLAHAIFLVALFATGVQDILDLRAVFLGRTTLLDARTTVPLFLASAILPLAWLGRGRPALRVLALGLVLFSAAGALTTQTRSQLLAMAAGGLVFLPFATVHRARWTGRPLRAAARRMALAVVLLAGLGATAVATVPSLRVLASAVALRTRSDQDNGRLANEWVPAVRQVSATPAALALGIGAGHPFITAEGEERTYVHNLGIYSLVYGGVLGVVATALLYLTAGVLLARRAWREDGLESAALLALLAALAVYAQFFAVHKLLSYNLMLALIVQAAVPPVAGRGAGAGG